MLLFKQIKNTRTFSLLPHKMAFTQTFKLTSVAHFLRQFASAKITTAGILVIGDEILKGEVVDTNSPHITKELHKLGIKVKKISVIGDEVEEISNEIKLFSKLYDYVITTGGIGPTHDDVTFEGVARAFNVPIAINPQLRKLVENFYNTTDVNHPGMKLAKVPESAKLNVSDKNNYPSVQVENVFLFPGIPQLFLRSFDSLSAKLFKSDGSSFHTICIYVNVTEDKIADELCKLVAQFPDVQVGSYPKLFDKSYTVKITIESTNEQVTKQACDWLLEKLPKDSVVDVK